MAGSNRKSQNSPFRRAPVDNQRADLNSPLSTCCFKASAFLKAADGLTLQSGNLWTHHSPSPYFLSGDYHQHHEYISTIRSGSGGAYSGIITTKGGREGKDDPIFEVSDHMMCESLILLMCGCVEHHLSHSLQLHCIYNMCINRQLMEMLQNNEELISFVPGRK